MKRDIEHWRLWLVMLWLLGCAILLSMRWGAIHWYGLPDTDDNLRMAQVRALLNGQNWYDLRQYRLNPPEGFNVHWSRLVDLPIAGLQLLLRPFLGVNLADKWSAGLAPLIPFGVALAGLAVTLRRLIAPGAFVIAPALIFACSSAINMFMPMRVDHHGWQLAMLAWSIAGLVDPRDRRGGVTSGLSTALSLVIGLELLPFLALCGAALVLHWVWDGQSEERRVRAYAATLALGCLVGYLVFASYDNRVWRCDVLSPVWLTTMIATGLLVYALTLAPLRTRALRLAGTAAVGAVLAAGFALFFPQCLGAPEQISAELYNSWFRNVREAKPLYTQNWTVMVNVAALPVIGLAGALWALRVTWGSRAAANWGAIAIVSTVSLLLCFWQTRNGTAAQLLAIPGSAFLIWRIVPWLARDQRFAIKAFGAIAAFLALSTYGLQFAVSLWPQPPQTKSGEAIAAANRRCPTLPALRPIARMPAATIFTFVDLGPRLINTTHHRAIAGPYHRNGDAILDVHRAFDGTPDRARSIIASHGATLLLICPNYNESTVYRARSPDGFYARLARGERFAWLTPVALPANSPFKLWRVTP